MHLESVELETIVEYTAAKAAFNGYPNRIISPPESSACCATEMRVVGENHWGESGPYTYKQCSACNFTVRQFLPVE